jgi:NAD(P)-dependent dehydrogenase (short-subunit alcohol dehydrogenase family)
MGLGGRYSGLRAYGFSKLACILFIHELARRLGPESRISTYVVGPGLVNTDMGLKDASPVVRLVWLARRRKGSTPAEGASTSILLATDPARRSLVAAILRRGGRTPALGALRAAHGRGVGRPRSPGTRWRADGSAADRRLLECRDLTSPDTQSRLSSPYSRHRRTASWQSCALGTCPWRSGRCGRSPLPAGSRYS